jgi:hypothetical protein
MSHMNALMYRTDHGGRQRMAKDAERIHPLSRVCSVVWRSTKEEK